MPNPNTAAQTDLTESCTETSFEISESVLPVHCPMPGTSLWNSHPRVYIPLGDGTTEAKCPYCGTLYKLVK